MCVIGFSLMSPCHFLWLLLLLPFLFFYVNVHVHVCNWFRFDFHLGVIISYGPTLIGSCLIFISICPYCLWLALFWCVFVSGSCFDIRYWDWPFLKVYFHVLFCGCFLLMVTGCMLYMPFVALVQLHTRISFPLHRYIRKWSTVLGLDSSIKTCPFSEAPSALK